MTPLEHLPLEAYPDAASFLLELEIFNLHVAAVEVNGHDRRAERLLGARLAAQVVSGLAQTARRHDNHVIVFAALDVLVQAVNVTELG